jgi:hypothetical protein
MNLERDIDRRQFPDRRQEPTSPWDAMPPAGQRIRARRAEEHGEVYYVDRFSVLMLALVVTLLAASITDAAFTVRLVAHGCAEVNPLMGRLLDRGVLPFFIGKYLLTAVGLPVLLIFKNHYLFGTRFRVGYVIPVLVSLYLILIAYQLHLLDHLRIGHA